MTQQPRGSEGKPSKADYEKARACWNKYSSGNTDYKRQDLVDIFAEALALEREEARIGWVSHATMVSQINASLLAVEKENGELLAQNERLAEALRCYRLNFPCPGQEVGPGAGVTSGCSGDGKDCPTCEAGNPSASPSNPIHEAIEGACTAFQPLLDACDFDARGSIYKNAKEALSQLRKAVKP